MVDNAAEPTWLSRRVVEQIHHRQLQEHGGSFGLREESRLESALSRPENTWHYGNETDLHRLAAVYADGIISNHPFVDGNKRTGFLVAFVFLRLNGLTLETDDSDVVVAVRGLAAGEWSAEDFGDWLRKHTNPTE